MGYASWELKLTLIEFRFKTFNVTQNVTESTQVRATSEPHERGLRLRVRKELENVSNYFHARLAKPQSLIGFRMINRLKSTGNIKNTLFVEINLIMNVMWIRSD